MQVNMLPVRRKGEWQWRIMAACKGYVLAEDIIRHAWDGKCTVYDTEYELKVKVVKPSCDADKLRRLIETTEADITARTVAATDAEFVQEAVERWAQKERTSFHHPPTPNHEAEIQEYAKYEVAARTTSKNTNVLETRQEMRQRLTELQAQLAYDQYHITIGVEVEQDVPSDVIGCVVWGLILHEHGYAPREQLQKYTVVLEEDSELPEQDKVMAWVQLLLTMSDFPCSQCLADATNRLVCPCLRAHYCCAQCQSAHWRDNHQDECNGGPPPCV